MNSGRLVGIVLMVVGFGLAVLAGAWISVQVGSEALTTGGAVIGAVFAFVLVTVLVGFGIFLYVRGGQEAEQDSVIRKQRQLVDLLKTRGEVSIHEMALDLQVNADQVKEMVSQLVGLQVFSGFVNWDDGILYSSDAGKLRDLQNCKKCGAPITLAGKGVVVCKFCGTEYFLT